MKVFQLEQLRWKRSPGVRSEGGGERRRRVSSRVDNMNIDRVTEWSRGGGGGVVGGGSGGTIATTTRIAGASVEAEPVGGGKGDSGISAEWSGSHGALATEVELRLHPSPARHAHPTRVSLSSSSVATNSTSPGDVSRYNSTRNDTDRAGGGERSGGGGGVVVRAEEALIVTFVLLLWVAAIALFINRWGKIRMLEPYQPKFQQQHRSSCPASIAADPAQSVPPPTAAAMSATPAHHRLSLSRGCSSCGDYPLILGGGGGATNSCRQTCLYLAHRPRQNSVFAGSSGTMTLIPESPARRSHSAADLRALLLPRPPSTSRQQRNLAVTDV